jgi:hypothetical protein
VEEIDFGVNFVAGNSNKLQKLGLGRKNQLNPNVKNKECVHSISIIFRSDLNGFWVFTMV